MMACPLEPPYNLGDMLICQAPLIFFIRRLLWARKPHPRAAGIAFWLLVVFYASELGWWRTVARVLLMVFSQM